MNNTGHGFVIMVITLQILGIVSTIGMIGKDRKPVTPGFAISALLISAIVITLGVWTLWSNR